VVLFLASVVRESYEDTLEAVKQADLVVTHPVTFGPVLAAQKAGVPWVSLALAPLSFLSALRSAGADVSAPWMVQLRASGPGAMRRVMTMAKLQSLPWVLPVLELRKELGLGAGGHPLLEGQHAPRLVLAVPRAATTRLAAADGGGGSRWMFSASLTAAPLG